MRFTFAIATAAMLVWPVAVWAAPEESPTGATEVDFAFAGVAVTVPPSFQAGPPMDEHELATFVRRDAQGQPEMSIALAAVPVAEDVTLEKFGDAVIDTLPPSVRSLKMVSSDPIDLGGHKALLKRISYTFRGNPAEAERLFLIVKAEGDDSPRVGYCLTVEAPQAKAGEIAGVRKQVAGSLAFDKPASAVQLPIVLAEKRSEHKNLGLSVRLPALWKVQSARGKLRLFQFDYRLKMPYPLFTVWARAAQEGQTAQQCLDADLAIYQKLCAEQGFKVLNKSAAALGGKQGAQAVMQVTQGGRDLLMVQRCVTNGQKIYTTALTVPADLKPNKAVKILDTIAKGIAFLPVKPATATQPGK